MNSWQRRALPAIFVILTAVCFGLGLFCDRLVGAHLSMLVRRLALLGAGMLAVGGITFIARAVRTGRHISRLHQLSETVLPDAFRLSLHRTGIGSQYLTLLAIPESHAFCYGFLKPRICLSVGLVESLSPAQLQAVLLHEDYHRRHFHPLRILLLDALSAAFFYLPVVGEWCKLQKVEWELAADRYAVERAGEPALAGALHRLLSCPPDPVPGAVVGLSVNEVRVARLLGDRPPSLRFSDRSVLVSAVVLLAACMVIV